MTPPKGRVYSRKLKSKKQRGSSSAAVQSPSPDPPAMTSELHSEAATAQEPPSSTITPEGEGAQHTTPELPQESGSSHPPSAPSTHTPATHETPPSCPTAQQSPTSTTHEGATPVPPPVASSGLLSMSKGERDDIIQRACYMAGGVSAGMSYLKMMKLEETDSSAWLEHGLSIMASTFPNVMSTIKMIQDLGYNKEDEQVMDGIFGALEDMEKILDGYSLMTKQLVKKVEKDRGGSGETGVEHLNDEYGRSVSPKSIS